jgi:ABC-type multidrug transport system ATPase subunit
MRERIAYVPETPALYDDLTVAQSLRFGELVYRQWHPERASEWQRRFCLQGNRKVGELSKGMRTKLALLMGISHDAELLLLDEPTAGLDPESRSEFQMHLKTLAAESGACLVVSSHLFEDAEQAAEEFLVLRDGRIRFRSTVSEVGRMKIYSLPYAKVEAFSDSKGHLIARKEKQEAYVLVLDPENLPPGIEAVLEDAVARPASLREIYFALEGSRNGGNWSCFH